MGEVSTKRNITKKKRGEMSQPPSAFEAAIQKAVEQRGGKRSDMYLILRPEGKATLDQIAEQILNAAKLHKAIYSNTQRKGRKKAQ